MKDNSFDYHFYASAPKCMPATGNRPIKEMLRDYCLSMENSVRKYPLQWYNYYDFGLFKPKAKPKAKLKKNISRLYDA